MTQQTLLVRVTLWKHCTMPVSNLKAGYVACQPQHATPVREYSPARHVEPSHGLELALRGCFLS